ncbi:HAMP domain-containing sensor histidine kinase [Nodosilinea sp. E11]|uniref:sensor histidine kinase n=1 Tax=Nodosilinea sp. E11 TaxID=3037479 RepID=UPI0029343BEA|nr:HAMP domain-containing sensor histidine kinase [Nodosilinea sp. E11]WOD39989.1 HAMP domain-containing sensor histidine kinase [Nodosilinea sp. E11]
MTAPDQEDLRVFCRDDEAFAQLQQVLSQREMTREQYLQTMAQQTQQTQALEAQRQAAEAASQAKSRFLAMISHELRTPLNSILGLSALLSRQVVGPLNAKQLEYLNYINGSGEHLLAIISDILDLSKVEAGQEHLRLTEVSLPDLCQSCLAMVQPRATEKTLTLTHQVAADATTCTADERRLRQMLLNLLTNAIKFTSQGQVTLTVQRCDALIEFRVEDTGIGIPANQLEHIFQPFTQIDRDLDRQYDGAGLGLALTRQLAQLHGGHLRVESAEGQGSQFLLYLPRQGGDRAGTMVSTTSAPTTQHRDVQRLMVIDCDLDHHQPLFAYVRACGWQVDGYQSWPEVHHHLRQLPLHLLPQLLVVGDREADNPALLEQLQQIRPPRLPQPIKVAILYAEQAPKLATEAYIVDACIQLPLTIPKLERMLSL